MPAQHTLLDVFQPPPELVGQIGLLSAFSATADFLESAVVMFTRLSAPRRESLGQPFLFLLLDGHQTSERTRVLKPNQVPGVHELWPRNERHKDLLHAKVGLLRFGLGHAGPSTLLRLIVTTGNWTQASARRQLEIAWQLDVPVIGNAPQGPWVDRADLREAAAFFNSVLTRFAVAAPLREMIRPLLDIAQVSAPGWRSKRFIHTLQPADDPGSGGTSIYEHLLKKAPHDRERPRDLIICGAGFYEKTKKKGSKPEVLAKLEQLPGVRHGARFALARKTDAGAIADWNAEEDGWTVVEAIDSVAERRASTTARSLHAKFVYIGRKWGRSSRDGWLYVGSGNLTRRGFLLAPETPSHGNVEAGVIIGLPETLDAAALASQLFVDMNADQLTRDVLASGHDDEDDLLSKPVISSPPMTFAKEEIDSEGVHWLRLSWNEGDVPDEVTLSWHGVELVAKGGTARVRLADGCPPHLALRVNGAEFLVPVMDAAGRLCRVPLTSSTFDDALADILNFPVPRAEEEDKDDDDDDVDEPVSKNPKRNSSSCDEELTYPLQEAMDLIEGIAARQAAIPPEQFPDWFRHLETRLVERFTLSKLRAWQHLDFPVLETLAKPDFSPPNMTLEDSRAYTEMLRRVRIAWGLTS